MNDYSKEKCLSFISILEDQATSEPFLAPVNPKKDGCPDYYHVIKKPMDLRTIRKKLEQSQYKTVQQWRKDVELIWQNAMTYNEPDTWVYDQAGDFKKLFLDLTDNFTGATKSDWLSQLDSAVDELTSVVALMGNAPIFSRKRSPSYMSLTSKADSAFSDQEIYLLEADINSIDQIPGKIRLRDCLKTLEPHLFAQQEWADVDLFLLPQSTLIYLREEVNSILGKNSAS